MSHALAKKIDKIVSKLSSKHKETKQHVSDPTDYHLCPTNAVVDGNRDGQQDSILQRMKFHLGHTAKAEHPSHPEGVPPIHVIADDLKDSPFKGKVPVV
jgi:hypothetical protein